MRSFFYFIFPLMIFSLSLAAEAPAPTKKITQDADLSTAPASYRIRVTKFRKLLRKEPTREAKIKKALALAKNKKSEFRIDAINFLAETRSQESVPGLIELVKDPNVTEFALYALGENRSIKSIPIIIESLTSEDENVRGNAEKALKKITRINFAYSYAGSEGQRKKYLSDIRRWWDRNQNKFVIREESPEEKKEAEEAWEKYGKQYIEDLSR